LNINKLQINLFTKKHWRQNGREENSLFEIGKRWARVSCERWSLGSSGKQGAKAAPKRKLE